MPLTTLPTETFLGLGEIDLVLQLVQIVLLLCVLIRLGTALGAIQDSIHAVLLVERDDQSLSLASTRGSSRRQFAQSGAD